MKRLLISLAAISVAAALTAPANATGKMTCDAPKTQWKPIAALKQSLTAQKWAVRKAKVDGGCYEVYGTTPEGDKVEAYFHPVSFEKLLVSRRGQVLFRKK